MLKNIIIVCDFAYIEGGASRVAHESAITLSEKYNVTLFSAVSPVSDQLKNSKVNVVCLNQSDILNNANRLGAIFQGIWNNTAKKEFNKLLSQYSPEDTIIHVHTWTKGLSSSIFKVSEKLGFKVALTIHDFFLICPNGVLFDYQKQKVCEIQPLSPKCLCTNCDSRSYKHKLFRILRQIIQNFNIRRCKNISYIYIAEFSKDQLMRRNPKILKTYFVPNPINFENNITVDCKNNDTYLYAARLTEDKGIRIFCEAVEKAGVKAFVLGVGQLKDELEKKYKNICFEGWVDKKDMTKYLNQTRCYVFPSIYYEGSPLTPLEMLACNIPVIVSDISSSKDIIEPNKNGLLYDGYSVDQLVQCIKKTQDDKLLQTMIEYISQNFSKDRYSMENHINALSNVYTKIMKED